MALALVALEGALFPNMNVGNALLGGSW